jgi:hypothetical protein
MSLLDALVLDSLLNPPVVLQEIWIANRVDARGAGTQADPYGVSPNDATNTSQDLEFDSVLRTIVASMPSTGMTVRLQPGTYFTRGFRTAYSGLGWKPAAKLRLVGSGVGVTKIKMTSQLGTTSGGTAVIGNDVANDFPDGIEISDLTIDGNLSGTTANQSVSGIDLNGKNIFVRRVDAVGLGQKGTNNTTAVGICLGHARVNAEPFNCVITGCSFREPGGATASGLVIAFQIATDVLTGDPHHLLCVIRDCLADFIAGGSVDLTKKYYGISAGGGTGTIVESNSIRNCQYGATWNSAGVTKDLVFRKNVFTNVSQIFTDPALSAAGIDRIILLNNTAEWPLASQHGQFTSGNFVRRQQREQHNDLQEHHCAREHFSAAFYR